jgi:hypothetical protein
MGSCRLEGIVFLLVVVCVSVLGQARDDRTGPRQSNTVPEVKQTVELMQGTWSGSMVAHVPGIPAETFNWTMECKAVALGAGVLCTNTGKASIGVMAESCLLAYDTEGKAVHYMCVTSMGEVHDHKGTWKDGKTIEFEPLRAGMMGQQITETLRWYFPDVNTIDKKSEVKLADGSSMNFEFNGKRQ